MKVKLLTTLVVMLLTPCLLVAAPGGKNQPRFVDNGDGTITDNQAGLMWEKKDAADGVVDYDNPHDVDNFYLWTSAADGDNTNPDGPAFTDFLPRLNGEIAGTAPSEQLGGHSDWRIPTSAELQTLLFESFPCSVSPCIVDPIFSPTNVDKIYWSSTSDASLSSTAWFVIFGSGNVLLGSKLNVGSVRAVRGGQ